jgi:hypothetical protein
MKLKLIVAFFLFFISNNYAFKAKDTISVHEDSISNWEKLNNIQLLFTQNAFVNWNAGGNNSMSGILKAKFTRSFKNDYTSWFNEIKENYGLNKEDSRELRKTDDLIELNSTFGYKTQIESNWYYSAKFNFRTQFSNGYKYPDTDKPISKFFAPAYMFIGIGTEYSSQNNSLKIYISPITNKTTFVLDQTLADEGAFGVKPATYNDSNVLLTKGENTKMEFGTLLTGEWNTKVMENIKMANRLNLYSDYLHNYGNIDVNWELNFDLTINKYISANVGTHLLFDDDVKRKEDVNNDGTLDLLGARIQLKQLLGIGFNYLF